MEGPDFWRDVILHPDDRAAAQRCIDAAARGEEIGTFEYRACTSDSRTVWVRDSARLVRVNGEPRLLRGAMVDVTPRKETELELQRKNHLLELVRELTA